MEEKILNENTLDVVTTGVVETVSAGKGSKVLAATGIVGIGAFTVVGVIATVKWTVGKIKNRKAAKAAEQGSDNTVDNFNEVEDEDSKN